MELSYLTTSAAVCHNDVTSHTTALLHKQSAGWVNNVIQSEQS